MPSHDSASAGPQAAPAARDDPPVNPPAASGPEAPCPSADVLEGLALGQAAAADVRGHLDACLACRTALERMRDDNRFLSGFAVAGALPIARTAAATHEIDVPGYQIVREIHRGGQGVVYQAIQRSTKRDVAIKVMKQGPFATLADRARFEREIETLGRLEHPNIVAVHDAGAAAGFHYFVMNYVDGKPLDEAILDPGSLFANRGAAAGSPRPATGASPGPAADSRAKTVAVLEMFIKVCDAVHAAHLRGVIHRDLKPSNIRVDRHGQPHVLDFGLAKPIDSAQDSAMTRTGQFVGSLPWASPEQVEGVSTKIDLRTDVYSLGAILYQLLTGALPFDVGSNLRDALDNILGRDPARPSALVRAAGGPRLDDELDTIVLKCLAKDRERRYQSAGDLARDLRHYLAGEPIDAKRDSGWYVLRKAAWRRRRLLLALAVPALLLPVAAVALYRSAAAARQAAEERSLREVEAVRNAAILEITRRLQARPGSPVDSPGGRLNRLNASSIRTDLDTGSLSVSDYGVALLLAETLRDRGSMEAIVEAESLVRQALYMLRRERGAHPAESGRMRTFLAELLLRRGNRMAEAEETAALAVEELTGSLGAASPEAARARITLARIRLARGDAPGAMVVARAALAADEGTGSILRDEALATVARAHAAQGERDEARAAYMAALRSMLRQTHDSDARLLDTLELGAALVADGLLPGDELLDRTALRGGLMELEAPAALREVTAVLRGGADGTQRDEHYVPARMVMVNLRERLLGPEDPSLGASLAAVASSLLASFEMAPRPDHAVVAETEALLRRAIPLQVAAHGPDSPLVGKSYEKLATCLVAGCRLREATLWFARDCELWMRQPPERRDEYQIMVRARWIAWHAARSDQHELCLLWSQRALDLVARLYSPEHGGNALMHACRALALASLGRTDEAQECEARALRLLAAQAVPPDQRHECDRFIGLARVRSNRLDEARTVMEPLWQYMERHWQVSGKLEYGRAMWEYLRAIGDADRTAQLEAFIRAEGRGDITPAGIGLE